MGPAWLEASFPIERAVQPVPVPTGRASTRSLGQCATEARKVLVCGGAGWGVPLMMDGGLDELTQEGSWLLHACLAVVSLE